VATSLAATPPVSPGDVLRQEVLVGWTDPEGSRPNLGALLLAYYAPDARLVYAGRAGTGMNADQLRQLREALEPLATTEMPLDVRPPKGTRFGSALVLSRVHWVRPKMVVEVTYLTWTDHNLLRQVVFDGVREDKPARDVVRLISVSREGAGQDGTGGRPEVAPHRLTSAERRHAASPGSRLAGQRRRRCPHVGGPAPSPSTPPSRCLSRRLERRPHPRRERAPPNRTGFLCTDKYPSRSAKPIWMASCAPCPTRAPAFSNDRLWQMLASSGPPLASMLIGRRLALSLPLRRFHPPNQIVGEAWEGAF
jgi:ATP dependent DNA ligase C terminal region